MRHHPLPPSLTFLSSALACALFWPLAATSADARRSRVRGVRPSLLFSQELSLPATTQKRRLLALRRSETPEGVRLTLTSDTSLDDYRAYVEGERFFVHIPQAALINKQQNPQGRGFADLRIEQRDDAFVLSFRLQPGASVNIKQLFHQLHVIFYTNERKIIRSNSRAIKPS